jgi:uncharacterized membrane protein
MKAVEEPTEVIVDFSSTGFLAAVFCEKVTDISIHKMGSNNFLFIFLNGFK